MSHFTKAQIEEIRQRLATKAVRDSDLPETTELHGEDYVAFVQDGINKKISANTFRDELQNGPQGESAYEILVRHGYEGTEDDWAEMMSNLVDDADVIDERLDVLELAGASISFTASPSVISSGTSTNVTLAVSVSGLEDAGADKIEILDSGSQVIAESSGTSLSKQVTLSVGASYTVRVTHGSASISKSLSVVAVGHIYYGSGTDASDFESNKVVYPSPTTSVARTYSVVVRNQGDYVFFRIPSTMTINKATLNGFGFPMSLIETVDGYKLYRSDNTYNAGTIQLVIS